MSAAYSPGTVAVLADEISRYTRFTMSLIGLKVPDGSKIEVGIGRNIAHQTNRIIRKMTGDWVHLQGDDHVFRPDLLLNLLAHDVDVVAPLVLMRQFPHEPVVFSHEGEDGMHHRMTEGFPEHGLLDVFAAGSAGMLIRKHVLDAIGDPWMEFTPVAGGVLGEDLSLCRKIRDAGFKIHVDMDNHIGHLTSVAAWPKFYDGEWRAYIDFTQGAT